MIIKLIIRLKFTILNMQIKNANLEFANEQWFIFSFISHMSTILVLGSIPRSHRVSHMSTTIVLGCIPRLTPWLTHVYYTGTWLYTPAHTVAHTCLLYWYLAVHPGSHRGSHMSTILVLGCIPRLTPWH